MQAGIDRHGFVDSDQAAGVVVAPFQLDDRQRIGAIAVNFVRAGEAEGRFGAEIARGHQQIQGGGGVHVEIVIGDRGGFVVRRLGRRMDYKIRPLGGKKIADLLAVADIQVLVTIARTGVDQLLYDRARGALAPEEPGAHVIVDANNLPPLFAKEAGAF